MQAASLGRPQSCPVPSNGASLKEAQEMGRRQEWVHHACEQWVDC